MSKHSRLDSWKEIARYLGRDVRTVIRWEQGRGLPVHRVPGGRISRVFAYPHELDEWLATRPGDLNGTNDAVAEESVNEETANGDSVYLEIPPLERRSPILLVFAVVAVVSLAGVIWTRAESEPIGQLAVAGNEIVAFDAARRTRWTHRIESGELRPPPVRWNHVGDIDGDGRQEIFAALHVRPAEVNSYGSELVRLSPSGALEWTARADDRFTFGDGEYGPPWPASDLTVYRAGGEPRIAWSLRHFTWWPSMVVSLNARGERLGVFVNSGWIRSTAPSRDGQYLFVTGISNSRRAYFLAVLDTAHPSGRAPEDAGSPMECVSCPEGAPLHYFVFPRTEVSLGEPFPAEGPIVTTFENGTVQVQIRESAGPSFAATVYDLEDLSITRARLADSYWDWHRRLETEGRLNHTSDTCPERHGLEVQHWTPADGWRPVKVAVR